MCIRDRYAAGDCTGGLLQVAKAVYEGAQAGTEAAKACLLYTSSGTAQNTSLYSPARCTPPLHSVGLVFPAVRAVCIPGNLKKEESVMKNKNHSRFATLLLFALLLWCTAATPGKIADPST